LLLQTISLFTLVEIFFILLIIALLVSLLGSLGFKKYMANKAKADQAMADVAGTNMVTYLRNYRRNKSKPCTQRCAAFQTLQTEYDGIKAGTSSIGTSLSEESSKWWDEIMKELKEELEEDCPNCTITTTTPSGVTPPEENDTEEDTE
jgi:Tfp pilus assembly protein PilE